MVAQPPSQDSPEERNEGIFQGLPILSSPEYRDLLKSSPEYRDLLKAARADELPAPVLVRAFRQLRGSRNAALTLERLLTTDSKYGYLRPLRHMARRRVSKDDWFSADDLVDQSIAWRTVASTARDLELLTPRELLPQA